jgi:hypothetical protein
MRYPQHLRRLASRPAAPLFGAGSESGIEKTEKLKAETLKSEGGSQERKTQSPGSATPATPRQKTLKSEGG